MTIDQVSEPRQRAGWQGWSSWYRVPRHLEQHIIVMQNRAKRGIVLLKQISSYRSSTRFGPSLDLPYTHNIFLIPHPDAESVSKKNVLRLTDPGSSPHQPVGGTAG